MKGWRFSGSRKKFCPFTEGKIPPESIHYTNVKLLKKYISDTYKIVPARITGVSKKYQARLVTAIKHARFLGLLPYCDRH